MRCLRRKASSLSEPQPDLQAQAKVMVMVTTMMLVMVVMRTLPSVGSRGNLIGWLVTAVPRQGGITAMI